MKKSALAIISSGALGALVAGSAFAADMALKAPPLPVWTWTGFYAGANIGYSWGRSDSAVSWYSLGSPSGPGLALIEQDTRSFNMDGVIGGGQIGYNWQSGNLVAGLEADIQGSGQEGTGTIVCPTACKPPFPPAPTYETLNEKLDWFGTVRGRLGVTVTPTLLLYGTGGLAYGEISTNGTISDPTSFSNNVTRAGGTVGAGLEGRLWGNWTGKIEYLYMDLGSISAGPVTTPIVSSHFGYCDHSPARCFVAAGYNSHITDNILRVGINYNFR